MLRDSHKRVIRDLRISLTDRCNFRCFYCYPNGSPPLARKDTILTFEEIARVSKIFVSLGIEKIRLTGGEPLLRRDLPQLVARLNELKPALKNIALTTNGFDFPRHAALLKSAGLDRVTISLDSLKRENFADITQVDALDKVYKAIEVARSFRFEPIKINAVVVRGRNDHELADFARFAREANLSVRFIEFMPLDSGHEWNRDLVVSGKEILETISAEFPLEIAEESRGSETAWRYRFSDGSPGEIGIIAPVTQAFCGSCSRIRLTADGQIRTCLFSATEHNLRSFIRSTDDDEAVRDFIRQTALTKEFGHSINSQEFVQPSRSMSFIGG